MIYLSDHDVFNLGNQWEAVCHCMRQGIDLIYAGDFAQPVKPYLRYGNPRNRIISMPAYAGGSINTAGIKWIASYPGNVEKGLDRAHSTTILNEAGTGVPFCIINTNRISAIRTAGVTSVIIQEYLNAKNVKQREVTLGIAGFGPIGQTHLSMCTALFSDIISRVYIFDLKPVNLALVPPEIVDRVVVIDSWQKAYSDADIFITCTVSSERYIDMDPKPGSLHCNISLRDYKIAPMTKMERIIVDDWEEICREKTDIEYMYLDGGLNRENVFSFLTHTLEQMFARLDPDDTVMFNPMGMAVFDVCTARLFYEKALQHKTYSEIPG